MMESEWLNADDPEAMLELVRDSASGRKFRLFAAACCRSIQHTIQDKRCLDAIDALEAFADGAISPEEFARARDLAGEVEEEWHRAEMEAEVRTNYGFTASYCIVAARYYAALAVRKALSTDPKRPDVLPGFMPEHNARPCSYWTAAVMDRLAVARLTEPWGDLAAPFSRFAAAAAGQAVFDSEGAHQARLLRDLIGTPLAPPPLIEEAHVLATRDLARSIYDNRAFHRMPELRKRLEEAGCDARDVLRHCSSGHPHVRGCWVLDTILGRE